MDEITDFLHVLDERERKIIELRYGLTGLKPMTLQAIGKQFGVRRERIRQLQNIALSQMRRAACSSHGRAY